MTHTKLNKNKKYLHFAIPADPFIHMKSVLPSNNDIKTWLISLDLSLGINPCVQSIRLSTSFTSTTDSVECPVKSKILMGFLWNSIWSSGLLCFFFSSLKSMTTSWCVSKAFISSLPFSFCKYTSSVKEGPGWTNNYTQQIFTDENM